MKLKYALEFFDFDGGITAVPVNGGDEMHSVLHMNATTADILEILKNDVTEEEIVLALKEKYNATDEKIISNVKKVVKILREYNLILE